MVRRPKISERVDYEGELGVVIGKTCYQPAADADIRQYILGLHLRERRYRARSAMQMVNGRERKALTPSVLLDRW